MNVTYRKWAEAAVLKLCTEAPGQTHRAPLESSEIQPTPAGHHTNNSFQGIGRNHVINLTIGFFFCLGIMEKNVKRESLGTSGLKSKL